MFLKKSVQEVLASATKLIAENTSFTNMNAGSIARSIVESIAPEIGSTEDKKRVSLYDFALQVLEQGQLSKASSDNLNLIGGLFSYARREEEVRDKNGVLTKQLIDDDTYRYEISQVVSSMATANYSALRLEILTIAGVRDVVPKEYSHGTGSFSFIMLPMYGYDRDEVKKILKEAIEKVKAYGVRSEVLLPINVPVDLSVQLIFHETTTDIEKANIKSSAQVKMHSFFGTKSLGEGFIYNDLVQEVMNVHKRFQIFKSLSSI